LLKNSTIRGRTRPNVPVGTGGAQLKKWMECMYIVYVLQDSKGKLYKGMTNDLPRRLAEHRGGTTKTTRTMSQLQVVYTEKLPDRIAARKREKYLKSAAGRKFLKKILYTGA